MSILDTIKTIMDSETSEFRAEQSASLASLTLAADNKYRQQASDRAEQELELKLREETQQDLLLAENEIEMETQNEVDDLVDRYFKPIFKGSPDADYGDTGILDENTLNDSDYRTSVINRMTDDYDFSDKQAKDLYAVVSSYMQNPSQHTIVSKYITGILTSGNLKDYTKAFEAIGLYDEITGQNVKSNYNLAKGNSILARLSQLDNVSKDIKTEIKELRTLGDRKITRETGIPESEIDFNLGQAFNRQVKDEASAVKVDVESRQEVIDSINSIVQEQNEDGSITYTKEERKEITVLLNDVLGGKDSLRKELSLNTGSGAGKGEVFYSSIDNLNAALKTIEKKRKALKKSKNKQTEKRKDEMTMYGNTYNSSNPMNPEDIEIYGNLSNVKFDSELQTLNAIESIIIRDKEEKLRKSNRKN